MLRICPGSARNDTENVRKIAFPNFFGLNPLIWLIPPKEIPNKSLEKIWRVDEQLLKTLGFFPGAKAAPRLSQRFPRLFKSVPLRAPRLPPRYAGEPLGC